MASHLPPVPPQGRSRKGPAAAAAAPQDTTPKDKAPANLAEQDHQGNVKRNTTHQGYQQDR